MSRLLVDPDQIRAFAAAILRYASSGAIISLRTFDEGTDKTLSIRPVRINGDGLTPVIDAAIQQAQFAADHSRQAVFCPPLAGFASETNAREIDLIEGYVLTAECDQSPQAARQRLEALLGRATMVVESGGFWLDPATGETQPKQHLHWRLNEPATDADLIRLKRARRLVTTLVKGDPSNIPAHPIRWPGSAHRKREPRLATIVAQTEHEIDLGDALERLQIATGKTGGEGEKANGADKASPHDKDGDDRPDHELIANITSGRELHPSLAPLAARLVGRGMYAGSVVNTLRGLMEAIPAEQRDFRWQRRWDEVPRTVQTAEERFGPKAETAGMNDAGEPAGAAVEIIKPVDLWAKFDPPTLPTGLLPPVIEEFAFIQGETMGADPGGLGAAALAICAAAIPDRVRLQVKQNDPHWQESARQWLALIGDPSSKKSPILSQVARPLLRLDAKLFRDYCRQLADYNALPAEERKDHSPPKQKRLRLEDTTIEAAQEVLQDSPDGVLCLQDELAGWFGSMDKYSGNRGAAKDRGFWLQSFNGGPYAINRVGRGAGLIENLSVSILGGIQPEPIRKLAADSLDDGLLQRLCPIVLRPGRLGRDEPQPDVVVQYEALVEALVRIEAPGLLPDLVAAPLRFDDGAQKIRRELEQRHLDLMTAESVNRKLAAHIGKYDGLFARLCIVWHCIENPERVPRQIPESTARRVAEFLHRFLFPHAVSFYAGILGLSDDNDRLTSVAGYILAHKLDVVTNRDVQRGDRTMRGLDRQSIQRVFEQLDALGWVSATFGRRAIDPPRWLATPPFMRALAIEPGRNNKEGRPLAG